MKKTCFIFVLCCFWFSAHAAVRIGVPIYAPPFIELYDPLNGVSGFDVDFMKKICTSLNWKCEFIPMKFRSLLPALKENKIDLAIGAIVIPTEKQPDFLYSMPYIISEVGFLLRKDSSVNTVNGLDGKSVGAVIGRAYLDYLQENYANKMTIVPYDLSRTVAIDLYNRKVDAVCMNYFTALFIKNQHPDQTKVLHEHFKVGEGMGIVTLPANKDKMGQINKVILQFESDGTFTQLYNYTFAFIIPQT